MRTKPPIRLVVGRLLLAGFFAGGVGALALPAEGSMMAGKGEGGKGGGGGSRGGGGGGSKGSSGGGGSRSPGGSGKSSGGGGGSKAPSSRGSSGGGDRGKSSGGSSSRGDSGRGGHESRGSSGNARGGNDGKSGGNSRGGNESRGGSGSRGGNRESTSNQNHGGESRGGGNSRGGNGSSNNGSVFGGNGGNGNPGSGNAGHAREAKGSGGSHDRGSAGNSGNNGNTRDARGRNESSGNTRRGARENPSSNGSRGSDNDRGQGGTNVFGNGGSEGTLSGRSPRGSGKDFGGASRGDNEGKNTSTREGRSGDRGVVQMPGTIAGGRGVEPVQKGRFVPVDEAGGRNNERGSGTRSGIRDVKSARGGFVEAPDGSGLAAPRGGAGPLMPGNTDPRPFSKPGAGPKPRSGGGGHGGGDRDHDRDRDRDHGGSWGAPRDRWDNDDCDDWRRDSWCDDRWTWRHNRWNRWHCNDWWWNDCDNSGFTFTFSFGNSCDSYDGWYYGRPWCGPRTYWRSYNPWWGTRWYGYSPGWYSSWRDCGFVTRTYYSYSWSDPYCRTWYDPWYDCDRVYVRDYPTNVYVDYDVFYTDDGEGYSDDESRWENEFGAESYEEGGEAWLYGGGGANGGDGAVIVMGAESLEASWNLLADGRLEEAREAFTNIAESYPGDGAGHIGYGLSVALLGNAEAATSAMRRALRDDPEALRRVPTDAGVTGKVRLAMEVFRTRANTNERDVDALFMIGVLHYLAGDSGRAYVAVDTGIEMGDSDSSALNLRRMIRSETMANEDRPSW